MNAMDFAQTQRSVDTMVGIALSLMKSIQIVVHHILIISEMVYVTVMEQTQKSVDMMEEIASR